MCFFSPGGWCQGSPWSPRRQDLESLLQAIIKAQAEGHPICHLPFAMLGFLDSLGGKKWEKHILVALVGALEHGWIIFCHILGMS